jgi:glycosyltransferase involved in cell wall biosynthesis
MRVLYSFPHKIGADRICHTAWQQVNGLAQLGIDVTLFTGAVARQVPRVKTLTSLARGRLRIPYRLLGRIHACALHDRIVARHLRQNPGRFDVVHCWPLGALETMKAAKELGIPTVLERPNAHTRFCYEVVRDECQRIGVELPRGHEHEYNPAILAREEEEFALADFLLCPSEFVAQTFRDKGFREDKLLRHQYGYDAETFYPENSEPHSFTMLFAGGCAVRKGLHFAVDAWLLSNAIRQGVFLIAGDFVPDYWRYLKPSIKLDPSIIVLGHRKDVAHLMRQVDVFILPTLEEGSPLVCYEAMASGCAILTSEVCAGLCRHMENALIHKPGDVQTLRQHISILASDKQLLARLRKGAIESSKNADWSHAAMALMNAYERSLKGTSTVAVPVAFAP